MNIRGIAAAMSALLLTSGCASVMEGTTQQVAVDSDPAGADCTVSNSQGKWPVKTPGAVTVQKSASVLVVHCSKAGYQNGSAYYAPRMSSMAAAGAMMPYVGLIDAVTDASSGAAMIYPDNAFVLLKAAPVADASPAAAPQSAAQVAPAAQAATPPPGAQANAAPVTTQSPQKEHQ